MITVYCELSYLAVHAVQHHECGKSRPCGRCGGTGTVPDPNSDHPEQMPCPVCDGTGKLEGDDY